MLHAGAITKSSAGFVKKAIIGKGGRALFLYKEPINDHVFCCFYNGNANSMGNNIRLQILKLILLFFVLISPNSIAQTFQGFNTQAGYEPDFNQCAQLGYTESYLRSYQTTGLYCSSPDCPGGLQNGPHTVYQWMCNISSTPACPVGQNLQSPASSPTCVTPTPAQCISYAQSGGGSAYISSGGNTSCQQSIPQPDSQCLLSGYNCYTSTPMNSSSQCGTVNGNAVCVTSPSSTMVGNSNGLPNGGASSTTAPQLIGTTNNSSTTTTNTTNNTTTTTTSSTSSSSTTTTGPITQDDIASGEFEFSDGSYGIPAVCENGQFAASLADCDTAVSCPSHQFVLGHVCMDLPEVTTTDITTTTDVTSTTIDDTTGNVIDNQTSTTQQSGGSSLTGTSSGSGSTTVNVEFPECDPSMEYCGDGIVDVDNYAPGDLTYDGLLQEYVSRISAAPIIASLDTFFSYDQTGTCPVWSASVPYINIDLVFDHLCSDIIPWSIIGGIFLAICAFFAGRIAFT